MAELDMALADLEAMLNTTEGAGKTGSDLIRFVIESRARTIGKIGNVVQLANKDPRLTADPALQRQFSDRLQALRLQAAAIQGKWRAADMENDMETYGRESLAAAQALVDFCRWARASLSR